MAMVALDARWVEPEKAANAFFGLEDEAKWALIAPELNAGLTLAEMNDAMLGGSAGFVKSMDPKSPLNPFVSNQTTEGSALNAVVSMPRVIHGAVFNVTVFGICRCTAGGPVNMTVRLRNTTDGTILGTGTVSLIVDADGSRPWRFAVEGEGNFVLADAAVSVAKLEVGAGTGGAPLVQALSQQAIAGAGTDPQNWDVTCQFSVANAGILASVYGARVTYALPGA